MRDREFKIIVIGVSAGGVEALRRILPDLPADFPLPIVIVQHLHPEQNGYLAEFFDQICRMKVIEPIDKTPVENGCIYFAPAGYHLLVEDDETFSLSMDEKVCYCRPSIDVLFKSAADVYDKDILAIILTGANSDGTDGIKYIKSKGGVTIAQEPASAYSSIMPSSAINSGKIDKVLPLSAICNILKEIKPLKS